MSDPLAVRPQNKSLAVGTALGVVGLALGGFTLSFTALRELASREFAIAPELAFIYPLVIDGFIVIATAAAFTMKKRGPRTTWYPWAALAVFGALSVLGNAAHAIDNPSATFPAWVSAVGASVPAVALLIASHLLVMMIDGKVQPRAAARRAKAPVSSAAPAPTPEAETVSPTRQTSTDAEIETASFPHLRAVGAVPRPVSLADQVAEATSGGTPVTAALVAKLEGVSERTGRRRLAELKVQRPDLFDTRAFEEAAQ